MTLESSWSYTYSVWPDSSAKRDVSVNMYKRPIYNYKLECHNSDDRDMETAIVEMQKEGDIGTNWEKMLDAISRMGLACLIVILVAPIALGHTGVAPPAAFITVSGMLIAILEYSYPAEEELRARGEYLA